MGIISTLQGLARVPCALNFENLFALQIVQINFEVCVFGTLFDIYTVDDLFEEIF